MDWLICKSELGVELEIGCDIIVGFDLTSEMQISNYPVETGFDPADHSRKQPNKFNVKIVQSRTPIGDLVDYEGGSTTELQVRKSVFEPSGLLLLTSAVGNAVGSLIGLASDDATKVWLYDVKKDVNYVNRLLDSLLTSQALVHECTIDVKGKTYTGYRMTSVKMSYESPKDGLCSFDVSFQELRVVATKTTKMPTPAQLKPKIPKGKLVKKELSEAEKKAAKRSLLDKGLSGALGL